MIIEENQKDRIEQVLGSIEVFKKSISRDTDHDFKKYELFLEEFEKNLNHVLSQPSLNRLNYFVNFNNSLHWLRYNDIQY